MSEAQTAERKDAPEVLEIRARHKQELVRIESDRDMQLARIDAEMTARMPVALRMFFDDRLYQRASLIAERMAAAEGFTPAHLLNKPGACFAVISKALAWNLDPFSVAQSTYQVGGRVAYEGRLVQAIMEASGRLKGGIHARYIGDWSKVEGKFKIDGNKPVKTWTDADEEGLGIVLKAHLHGEDEPREFEFFLKQCHPRNASTWPTRPKQQLHYNAIRAFASVAAPSLLLGVPFQDDLPAEPEMREINPEARAREAQPAEERKSALHVIAQRNAPPKVFGPSAAEAAAEVVKKAGKPHRAAAAAPQQATAPDPVSSGPEAGEPAGGASTGQQSASLFEAVIDGVEFRQPEPATIALENLIIDSTAPGSIIDEYAAVLDVLPDQLANRILDTVARVNNERARKHEEAQRKRLAEEADRKLAPKKSKERPPEPASEARPEPERTDQGITTVLREARKPAAEPAPGGEDDVPPWVAEGEPERDQEPDSGDRYELKDELGKVIGTDLKAGDFLGLLQRAQDAAAPENVRRMKIHNRRELQRIVENEGPSWAEHARALLP